MRSLIACALALTSVTAAAQDAGLPVQRVEDAPAMRVEQAPPAPPAPMPAPTPPVVTPVPSSQAPTPATAGYEQRDVLAAAERVFGRGAEDAARLIERAFASYGKPNAYVVGSEVSGALGVGLRYGSGSLHHRIEGEMPVYWAGPSLGFDAGGDATKTFMLVYNLNDTADLFRAYPAAEGRAILVGGVAASVYRRGNVLVVPIRIGAGWRLGANIGWLRFTRESRLLPL